MKLRYKLVIVAFFVTVIGSFIWSAGHYYSKYQHEKERADEAYNSQMEDIRVETERLKEKAKKDIEAQHEKAMQATQAEIAKLAVVAARKILETGDSRDADSSK